MKIYKLNDVFKVKFDKLNFMSLGRNQLLNWINQLTQCQYQSIQMLADGIAFSQILEAIHPNSVNMSRLNMNSRYPDDCLRNLRILESALKKLKINQPISFEKMSQGKFQDNILFLQWIYSYCSKYGGQTVQYYQPYNRRLQILEKQGKTVQQMSPHLIPTQAYMSYQAQEQEQQYYGSQQNSYEGSDLNLMIQQKKQQMNYKIQQLRDDAANLEGQLKTQMETNWKLMHNIERSIEERNSLYLLLKQIQTIVKQSEVSSAGNGILSVVQEIPEDFS